MSDSNGSTNLYKGGTSEQTLMQHLQPNDVFPLPASVTGLKVEVEWTCPHSGLADLDVYVLLYDENSRFIQKLNIDHALSSDGAVRLEADLDNTDLDAKTHEECVYVNFAEVDVKTTAIMLFVDGGPRNFQFINTVTVTVSETNFSVAESGQDLMRKLDASLQANRSSLFRAQCLARKDFQGIAALVIYKDGWHSADDSPRFACRPVLEAVFLPTTREKDEYCQTITVNAVPCLLKYRPRLFPSVKSICAALSSTSLPKLKKSFQAGKGLPVATFTEVLFQQLYEVKPGVISSGEAAYTVAMLQEMFGQIDFNGDGAVDWDEFTTFCIHTGLIGTHNSSAGADSSGGDSSVGVGAALNQYVVEYREDPQLKDTILSSYSPLAVLRHAPSIKRLLVIQERRDTCLMLDESFRLVATLNPGKVLGMEDAEERCKLYDVCYIPSKDMYAVVASDHSLTVYREHMAQLGRSCTYSIYHRVYHTFLQIKVMYSSLSGLLCTVDCNNNIYGWQPDGKSPVFEVSRHKALVTEIIAIDKHQLFATCSLDRRVVLWSQTTRRVKGVLLGHKRGITKMSYGKDTLLTSGFECDARTWDLNLREPHLLLKGHRLPISDSKVMCKDSTLDCDMRAITVDDSGEFRLWSIGMSEMSENNLAITLQIFSLRSSDKVSTKFKCLLLPFDPTHSNSNNYSNLIAGSSKLVHFKPEKNMTEFVPPNCMLYSDTNACLMTAVGRSIFKYDMFTGGFQNSFDNLGPTEITCFASDGKEGRRLFLGFADGSVTLLNFASGQILSSAKAHSEGVTAMRVRNDPQSGGAVLYVGSSEGRLRTVVEHGGELVCHSSLDETFGWGRSKKKGVEKGSGSGAGADSSPSAKAQLQSEDGVAVSFITVVPEVKLLLLASSSTSWGGWNCVTLKTFFTIEEVEPITGLELLCGGGIYNRASMVDYESALLMEFEKIVTVAICTSSYVRIYSIDTLNVKASVSVNYSGKLSGQFKDMVVVSSDEGRLVAWDVRLVREESLENFYNAYPPLLDLVHMMIPHQHQHQYQPTGSSTSRGHGKSPLPLTLSRDSLDSNPFEGEDEEDHESVGSEASLGSHDSMFSMTSKMGVVVDDLGGGQHLVGAAKTLSIVSPLGSPQSPGMQGSPHRHSPLSFSPVKRPSINSSQRRHLHRLNTVATATINKDDILPAEEDSRSIASSFSWQAHSDTIQSLSALREDGCVVTNSLDGFHRVWNLHKECLGEMALPNLTEAMQARQKTRRLPWKFILEKIPVLKKHHNIAAELVQKVTGTTDTKFDKVKSRRSGVGLGKGDVRETLALTKQVTAQDKQRSSLLNSMGRQSSSNSSFGNEIIKTLKNCDVDPGGEEERGGKRGLMAEEEGVVREAGERRVSFQVEKQRTKEIEERSDGTEASVSPPRSKGFSKSGSMAELQTSKHLISARSKSTKKKKKVQSAYDLKLLSVFGNKELWNNPGDFAGNKVTAFSEHSISSSHHDGYIDEEGHAALRRIKKDKDKLDVYQRSQPTLLLKNIGMCTSIEYPPSDMSNSELNFGQQKHMYKNANVLISERQNMTDRAKQNARHALAYARIKNASGSVGKLVTFESAPLHSIALPDKTALLPPLEEPNPDMPPPAVHALETGRQRQRRGGIITPLSPPPCPAALSSDSLSSAPSSLSTQTPPKKKLDHIRISQYMGKIMEAEEGAVTQWEKDIKTRKANEKSDRQRQSMRRRRHRKPSEKKHTMASIERRLGTTIKYYFAVRGDLAEEEKECPMPTPKDLLPSYTLQDVKNFLDTFQRVDEDLSGTLDVNEWVEFLSGDKTNGLSKNQARKLFNNVDMTSQGVLSVKDLVPIVFEKGDKPLQEIISNYLEDQIAKSGLKGKEGVSTLEVESLFECYDVDHIGYITVRLLREKIKGLRLPLSAATAVTASFYDFEDDELLNISEFIRVFHTFICTM